MGVNKVLPMNAGDGQTSYAKNSGVQQYAIRRSRSVLDETIKDMGRDGFSRCFRMVDLGCSSGPNTFLAILDIVNSIEELCQQNNYGLPEFQVFLNDLPDNDFNNLFKLLPTFYENLNKEREDKTRQCFISGLPGSFYGRLFPCESLDFAYSSYSLQWLSRIPDGLESNKENIYLTKTSPPDVLDSYSKQFESDFSTFLNLRAQELVHGGGMVFTILGRRSADPAFCEEDHKRVSMVAELLLDMVAEGLVDETDLYSFNIPGYLPYKDEVESVILKEGSFSLHKLEVFENNWDPNANGNEQYDQTGAYKSAEVVAGFVRAFMEPLLVSHFGNSIDIDDLFSRYTEKAAEYMLSREKSSGTNIVVSLKRK